jgi:hypothetical protein
LVLVAVELETNTQLLKIKVVRVVVAVVAQEMPLRISAVQRPIMALTALVVATGFYRLLAVQVAVAV